MRHRDLIKEILGCLCFGLLMFMLFMGLYVISPAQPSMHSETAHHGGAQ